MAKVKKQEAKRNCNKLKEHYDKSKKLISVCQEGNEKYCEYDIRIYSKKGIFNAKGTERRKGIR